MQDGIEAAAAASAEASASASAAAVAQAQAIVSRKEDTCNQVGGTWYTGGLYADTCESVGYVLSDGSTYNYPVDFDANGNVIPDSCSDDAFSASNDCSNTQETVQQAETDCANGGYNGDGQPGEWHSDTDICSS
jgi:hypothetical protein